jgi:ATP synthase protein I
MQNDDKSKSDLKGLSFAYRISSELVAAMIVSVILGLTLDKFLDTKPIALISLIILGFFAGLLNIYRLIRRIENTK